MARNSGEFRCSDRKTALTVLKPIPRDFQGPDLVAEWLRVATRDPDLIPEDVRRILVTCLPNHLGAELGPVPAVPRIPYVTVILGGIVRPPTQDPYPVPKTSPRGYSAISPRLSHIP